MKKRKVNLFVIGAMKAGTTSFNELLEMHPEVYFSPIKEPSYFLDKLPKKIYKPSRFFNIGNYFKNDFPNKLHIAHVKKKNQYQKLFSLADKNIKYLAEGSTCYFHAKESAEKIHQYNPEAKLILITRDPLKRAFSHYKMDVGLGRTRKSFQQEMDLCISDFRCNKLSNWSYLGMSLYFENMNKYRTLYGDNLLVIDLVKLIEDYENEIKKICSFLEITVFEDKLPHSNISSDVKFKKLLYFFVKIGARDFFSLILPKKIRHFIFNILSEDRKKPLILNKESTAILDEIFKEDENKIKKLLK